MSNEILITKILKENQFNRLKSNRLFKFVLNELGTIEKTKEFLREHFNFKTYQVNKLAYYVNYEKMRYQIKVNKLSTPHIDSYQKQPINYLL